MNFLGMGAMEIIVIMVVALIIFGPERLPEMGAQAGKALRDFRNMTRDMTGEFEEQISDVRGVMDEMKMTVADVRRETRELATSMTDIADSAAEEVRAGARVVNEQTTGVKSSFTAGAAAATTNGTSTSSDSVAASNGTAASTAVATKAPKKKKVAKAPAKPTKDDPLADLGGFDESS